MIVKKPYIIQKIKSPHQLQSDSTNKPQSTSEQAHICNHSGNSSDSGHICTHNIQPIQDIPMPTLLQKYAGSSWNQQPTLKLYLYPERLGPKGCEGLSETLRTAFLLQDLTLDLSNNNIGNQGSISVLKALISLPRLNKLTLNLFQNGITDEGFQDILISLASSPSLTQIQLILTKNTISMNSVSLYSIQKAFYSNKINPLQCLSLSLKFNPVYETLSAKKLLNLLLKSLKQLVKFEFYLSLENS